MIMAANIFEISRLNRFVDRPSLRNVNLTARLYTPAVEQVLNLSLARLVIMAALSTSVMTLAPVVQDVFALLAARVFSVDLPSLPSAMQTQPSSTTAQVVKERLL
jgi:hypothetical protein